MPYTQDQFDNQDSWKIYKGIIDQVSGGDATAANQVTGNNLLTEIRNEQSDVYAILTDSNTQLLNILALLAVTDAKTITSWLKTINTSLAELDYLSDIYAASNLGRIASENMNNRPKVANLVRRVFQATSLALLKTEIDNYEAGAGAGYALVEMVSFGLNGLNYEALGIYSSIG